MMRKLAVIIALAVCCGCQSNGPSVTVDVEGANSSAKMAEPSKAIADRVWARSDDTGLPGVVRIFLDDGTLVMDSCWETYRLAPWRAESDSVVAWDEDGAEIRAKIVAVDDTRLVLSVRLRDGDQEQHYQAATVPYLCPDMPK
jgi:hypothetical protein